ncbi:MAG: histidine phosphatase family protein [Kiloniellaceae bacterium]
MIYLLRHGETEWNREGRLQGHGDSPLTERGLSQAVAMGGALRREIGDEDLAGYTLVSSPLGRTLATARCVAAVTGHNPAEIVEDPRLREHGFGAWEGEIYQEVEQIHPEAWRAREADRWHYQVPGGESGALVAARIGAWLAEQSEEARLIVVSHGFAGRVLRGLYSGATPEEMLALPEPQDAVFRLSRGKIVSIPAGL